MTVSRVPGSATANAGRDALSPVATSRTLRHAGASMITRETSPASANVRRDAFAVNAIGWAIGNAGLAVAGRIDVSVKQLITLSFIFGYFISYQRRYKRFLEIYQGFGNLLKNFSLKDSICETSYT